MLVRMQMDIAATTNTTNNRATTGTTTAIGGLPNKIPEAESDTPPRIQPTKPISYTNGVLKRHANNHLAMVVATGVAYKECLKNHAASLGGHALDGCGEFMPAPNASVSDPASLKCAACGCHRNFHRREPEEFVSSGGGGTTHVIEYHPHHRHHPLPPPGAQAHHHLAQHQPVAACRVRSPGSDNNSPPPISSSYYPGSGPHMLLALNSGSGGGNIEEIDKNLITNNNISQHHHMLNPSGSGSPNIPSRKRFRTKFSQDQKEKMQEFAAKVGWKLQKSNEDLVNGFCNEIGVERNVFKVWMHNNKHNSAKRSATNVNVNYGVSTNQVTTNHDINQPIMVEDEEHVDGVNSGTVGNSHSSNNTSHMHQVQYNGTNAAPTNGSSSSS